MLFRFPGHVVTIVDTPTGGSVTDEAQLLFQEAKQRRRRRRRRLIAWTVSIIVVVLVCVTAIVVTTRSDANPPRPVSSPVPVTGASVSGASFSARPVLCYAPPLTPSNRQPAPATALPNCGPSYQLTAANLAVDPDSGNIAGFTEKTSIPPDPQFASVASTSPSNSRCRRNRGASGVCLWGRPALCARAGRFIRLRDQVGSGGTAKWSVVGQPGAHQHRVHPVGRIGTPAVSRHHRDRRSRPGDLSPDHTTDTVEFHLVQRSIPDIWEFHEAPSERVGRRALASSSVLVVGGPVSGWLACRRGTRLSLFQLAGQGKVRNTRNARAR